MRLRVARKVYRRHQRAVNAGQPTPYSAPVRERARSRLFRMLRTHGPSLKRLYFETGHDTGRRKAVGGRAAPAGSVYQWVFWEEFSCLAWPHRRLLRRTQVGDTVVSTIILSLAHPDYDNRGDPEGSGWLEYETMLFGTDEDCWRWATREEAVEGHAAIVRELEAGTWRAEQAELTAQREVW